VRVFDRAVVSLLPLVPRTVVQRLSAPYIAGQALGDAQRTVASLNAESKLATVDILGEELTRPEEAEAMAAGYHEVLDVIRDDALDANVSVKLTALGLELDRELCARLLDDVVDEAARRDIFVRIDMESSACTDDTLALYRRLRETGRDNVGVALQAYLRRTLDDIAALADLRPSIRLCKGIYLEPEEIAYQDDEEVRRNFVACLDALLERDCYVAVATHDEQLIGEALRRVSGLPATAYELQMLLGVREARASELVAAGHRLRVYVPFGKRWYEYSLRRLQENPKLAGMIAKGTLARLFRRG
jgi:proline dehydrogenase